MRIRSLVAIFAVGACSAARAEEADIGGVKITLPEVASYCATHDSDPLEARLWEVGRAARQGQSILLADYVDCQELKDWKAGKRPNLDNYIIASSLLKYQDKVLADDPAAWANQVCDAAAKNGTSGDASVVESVQQRLSKAATSVQINETKTVADVGREPGACFNAMLTKIETEAGTPKDIVGVGATMLVKGRIIYLYTFTTNDGPEAVNRGLATSKTAAKALLDANP